MRNGKIRKQSRAGFIVSAVLMSALLFTGCLTTTARVPVPPPRVVEVDEAIQQYDPPVGEVAPVFWLDEPFVVDGDISKWNGLVTALPRVMVYGGSYNPDITSGEFTLATDGEQLFMLANIRDNVPNENLFSPGLAWRGDSVEIFIGTETGTHTRYVPGDNQIRLVPVSKTDSSAFRAAVNDVEMTSQMQGHVEFHDHGYIIEASVPLDVLNISSLRPGQRIRVEFQINDADRGERERMVHWMSPADDVYYDPSAWGDGIVVRPDGE